jgi:hypothetical protein
MGPEEFAVGVRGHLFGVFDGVRRRREYVATVRFFSSTSSRINSVRHDHVAHRYTLLTHCVQHCFPSSARHRGLRLILTNIRVYHEINRARENRVLLWYHKLGICNGEFTGSAVWRHDIGSHDVAVDLLYKVSISPHISLPLPPSSPYLVFNSLIMQLTHPFSLLAAQLSPSPSSYSTSPCRTSTTAEQTLNVYAVLTPSADSCQSAGLSHSFSRCKKPACRTNGAVASSSVCLPLASHSFSSSACTKRG